MFSGLAFQAACRGRGAAITLDPFPVALSMPEKTNEKCNVECQELALTDIYFHYNGKIKYYIGIYLYSV